MRRWNFHYRQNMTVYRTGTGRLRLTEEDVRERLGLEPDAEITDRMLSHLGTQMINEVEIEFEGNDNDEYDEVEFDEFEERAPTVVPPTTPPPPPPEPQLYGEARIMDTMKALSYLHQHCTITPCDLCAQNLAFAALSLKKSRRRRGVKYAGEYRGERPPPDNYTGECRDCGETATPCACDR